MMNKKLIKEINRINVLMELKNSIDVDYVYEQYEKVPSRDLDNTRVLSVKKELYIPKKDFSSLDLRSKEQVKEDNYKIYLNNLPRKFFKEIEDNLDGGWGDGYFDFAFEYDKAERTVKKFIKTPDEYATIIAALFSEKLQISVMDYIMTFFPEPNEPGTLRPTKEPSYYEETYALEVIQRISNHLSKFKKYNAVEGKFSWFKITLDDVIEYLHFILPAMSFLAGMIFGIPGMIVGAVLELVDAAIYYFYDGNSVKVTPLKDRAVLAVAAVIIQAAPEDPYVATDTFPATAETAEATAPVTEL